MVLERVDDERRRAPLLDRLGVPVVELVELVELVEVVEVVEVAEVIELAELAEEIVQRQPWQQPFEPLFGGNTLHPRNPTLRGQERPFLDLGRTAEKCMVS